MQSIRCPSAGILELTKVSASMSHPWSGYLIPALGSEFGLLAPNTGVLSPLSAQVGTVCEYISYFLVTFYATYASVMAIETPGGDDDKQWLTFWYALNRSLAHIPYLEAQPITQMCCSQGERKGGWEGWWASPPPFWDPKWVQFWASATPKCLIMLRCGEPS